MKIRLVIPIIKRVVSKEKFLSSDSMMINKRLSLLSKVFKFNLADVDLVVTSNNFFVLRDSKQFHWITQQLNTFSSKSNLLLGIDVLNGTNKFGGIKASVIYYEVHQKFKLKKQIWEVWKNTAKANKNTLYNFTRQDRVVTLSNKTITLLSCGDILKRIHQIKGLPNTDIYIDLAHLDFSNYSINKQEGLSWIQEWKGKEKIILVTQQLTNKRVLNKNFFDMAENKYKLVYPISIFENQKVYFFNKYHQKVTRNPDYILIDVQTLNDKEIN
jgi:hypothetical protein